MVVAHTVNKIFENCLILFLDMVTGVPKTPKRTLKQLKIPFDYFIFLKHSTFMENSVEISRPTFS